MADTALADTALADTALAASASADAARPTLLRVRGLTVRLPSGRALLDDLELDVHAGEVVVVLGGSGAGKSTLLRALFDRADLLEAGLHVEARAGEVATGLGLVPQRGALFDHLDIAGNVELALRNATPARPATREAVREWLQRVDLPAELAARGTRVGKLSGGQAQRLAVARTLAGGRPLVFYDEPSTGLDPYRVRLLADEIRAQAEQTGSAAVVVTHDVALAAAVGHRLLLLDPRLRRLTPLMEEGWPGPQADEPPEQATQWQGRLEAELIRRLADPSVPVHANGAAPAGRSRAARILAHYFEPFRVAGVSLAETFSALPSRWRDFLSVFLHVLRQSLWRPLPFYAIVSTLLGFTVLYVVSRVAPPGVRPDRIVELVGASYITALTPPLAAFLFVATSGNAVNAWLGGMGLTHQVTALEALGIPRTRYLWAPSWVALSLAFLVGALIFAGGLLLGGILLCHLDGVPNGAKVLWTDLLDPAPDRVPYTVRAGWLLWLYAFGIASDAVARGSSPKDSSDAVTAAMTKSVVACTLWVVALELGSVFILFAVKGGGP